MQKYLIGMLVLVSVTIANFHSNKIYIFIQNSVKYILDCLIKLVYLIRIMIPSTRKIRNKLSKEIYRRKYIVSNILDLKNSVISLSTSNNNLSCDIKRIDQLLLELKKEVNQLKLINDTKIHSENKYRELLYLLKTSTDNLNNQVEHIKK